VLRSVDHTDFHPEVLYLLGADGRAKFSPGVARDLAGGLAGDSRE
jgi:hypothetical protein